MKSKSMLLVALILGLAGCGHESPQQLAYDAAYKQEQDYAMAAGEAAPLIIMKYQEVIRMDPNSNVARKAQARIDVAQQNWNAYQKK
jgi:hypothetical protein